MIMTILEVKFTVGAPYTRGALRGSYIYHH